MNDVFSLISEKLETVASEDARQMFEQTFTLIQNERNVFVFGYSDKYAYRDFMLEYRNALMSAVGSVCGRIPELKFKQVSKKTETESRESFSADKPKKRRHGVRNFIAALVCLVLAFAIGVLCVNYIANRKFKENFYSVSLNYTYDNFRIIQLSDIHTSVYGKDNSELIGRLTDLNPDIIVLTGDCVDQDSGTENAVALCTALAKIAPTYYIYGNNECAKAFGCDMTLEALDSLIGATDGNRDVQKLYNLDGGLRKTLEATGVKVLFNESDLITVGENKIRIFGTLTSNPSAFWQYAGEEFNKFISETNGEIKIFACHEPVLLETLNEEYWGDLVLCGDTHGGVARLPGFGALYSRDYGFFPERGKHLIYGKYTVENSQVIVSSGLENKNPLRIFNQPEIVIVDINRY